MLKTLFIVMVRWYQKYLTYISFGCCRHYPTCSSYFLWQLENNTIIKAVYFTTIRLLSCNQLGKGGIDYPVVKFKKHNQAIFRKIPIKYWYVPYDKEYYYIIKNWERKDKP